MELKHLFDWHLEDETTWEEQLIRTRHHYRNPQHLPKSDILRSLGLLFFNSSLRTRTSMEVAAARLGAQTSVIIPGSGVWGMEWKDGGRMDGQTVEHIREAIGVLSRYYDALGIRLFATGTDYTLDQNETRFKKIIESASVPIINLESALYHPCQALADAATISEYFKDQIKGRRFVLSWAWHPHALPHAVPNSALLMATRLGMKVTLARPKGFELDPAIMKLANQNVSKYDCSLIEIDDQDAACEGADIIYAKAWGSQLRYDDVEGEKMLRDQYKNWQIRERHLGHAAFMHCLPVRRGVIVEDAVLDGPQAIHLLQAEFRLHAQIAILERAWNLI
ncbi:MAG: N-acetylornithine carbamoyltransferase [Bacteroidetes bacterium]|nr:N-acetylornithine carbamoyltransferase [Bacteroidota bacterium]MCY4204390.1 N-acetylornithine carbamoyltransferase [Bacteroidota bacterium]